MLPFEGESVLITGGTGSFGQEFVRTVLNHGKPKRLVILSRDELKQSEMRQRFAESCAHGGPLRFFLGDVRDRDRLYRAFDDIDVVVHAAALKQVVSSEYNPMETIKTNVGGAGNVIDAALDRGVRKVIALSTDKACNPVNLYGATKLCAEKLFVAANNYSGPHRTRFSVVRYGNVVGSRGSVVPLWKEHAKDCRYNWSDPELLFDGEQHACSGIQITDPRMTRFWVTLPQAVGFVLASLDRMQGGEVFVPKLPSVRIMDLARAIAPDCRTDVVGIRPGEKLHESLIGDDEARSATEHDDHYVIRPTCAGHLPDGWRYTSDTNDRWLSTSELTSLLS